MFAEAWKSVNRRPAYAGTTTTSWAAREVFHGHSAVRAILSRSTFPVRAHVGCLPGGDGFRTQAVGRGDGIWRGVTTVYGVPSYASAGYSLNYETEAVEKALQPYAAERSRLNGPARCRFLC